MNSTGPVATIGEEIHPPLTTRGRLVAGEGGGISFRLPRRPRFLFFCVCGPPFRFGCRDGQGREGARPLWNAPEAERWRRGRRRAQARDVTSGRVARARARSVGAHGTRGCCRRCYGRARVFAPPHGVRPAAPLRRRCSGERARRRSSCSLRGGGAKKINRPPLRARGGGIRRRQRGGASAARRTGGAPRFGAVAPMTSALLRRRSVFARRRRRSSLDYAAVSPS